MAILATLDSWQEVQGPWRLVDSNSKNNASSVILTVAVKHLTDLISVRWLDVLDGNYYWVLSYSTYCIQFSIKTNTNMSMNKC